MVIIQFPFDLEDPDMQKGFEIGQEERFQSTKPKTDKELVTLIRDIVDDSHERLGYNIGFLFGLYTPQETAGIDHPARL